MQLPTTHEVARLVERRRSRIRAVEVEKHDHLAVGVLALGHRAAAHEPEARRVARALVVIARRRIHHLGDAQAHVRRGGLALTHLELNARLPERQRGLALVEPRTRAIG